MIAKERAKAALKAATAGGKRKAGESSISEEPSAGSNAKDAAAETSQKKSRTEKKEGKKHKDKKNRKFDKWRETYHLRYHTYILSWSRYGEVGYDVLPSTIESRTDTRHSESLSEYSAAFTVVYQGISKVELISYLLGQ